MKPALISNLLNFRRLLYCAFAVLLCSCAATSLKKTWKSPEYNGGPISSAAVLTIDERTFLRQGFENLIVGQLRKSGVNAISTYDLFSLPQINQDKPAAAARLRALGAQSVVILRLADLSSSYRESRPGYQNYAEVVTGYEPGPWYDYYSVAYTDMGVTYGNLKQKVYLETSIFDLNSSKRLWAGLTQTTITDTMDRSAQMEPIVVKVTEAMRRDGMLP